MIEANVHGLIRMTRLCLPHIRDGGHIVNMDSIAGKQAVRERGRLLRRQGGGRRCSAQALREDLLGRPIRITGSRARARRRHRVLARPLQGRRGEGGGGLQGRRAADRRGHRRLHPLRADPPAARERRRDRRQGARPVERRPHPAGPVDRVALTILEGSTFCICDERGDICEQTGGFFARGHPLPLALPADDERRDAAAPLLGQGRVLTRPRSTSATRWPTGCRRTRSRSSASASSPTRCRTGSSSRTSSTEPVSFELAVEVASDFADIFAVKEHDFSLGDPMRRQAAARPGRAAPRRRRGSSSSIAAPGGATTQVAFSELGDGRRRRRPLPARARPARALGARPPSSIREHERPCAGVAAASSEQPCEGAAPAAGGDAGIALQHSFERSVADLAALRMRGGSAGHRAAAGGRHAVVHDRLRARHADHLVPDAPARAGARPRRARGARRAPGDRGRPVDRRRAGEDRPRGPARQGGEGLVPALLRDGRRDPALPRAALGGVALDRRRRARPTAARAGAARARLDRLGVRDGDGFVAYERRTERGLENQSWKDSGDSQRFADGRIAEPPIAPVEVQGYAYDAKRRMAELAREVWGEPELAERLEREAADLQQRFDEAYWTRRALRARARRRRRARRLAVLEHRPPALERDRPGRARRRGRRRADGRRRSGRAGASARCPRDDAAYNPLSYHNGTVWPHDNSLIAAGLARYGRWEEARRIVRRDARGGGVPRPRAAGGLRGPAARRRRRSRSPTRPPRGRRRGRRGRRCCSSRCSSASSPEARQRSRPSAPPELPVVGGSLRLSGVRAFGRAWNVRLEEGRVGSSVEMRIAVISPVWFPVPPTGYGGIEWIVWLLADGLVDAGHDVTLFASRRLAHEGEARRRSSEHAPSARIGHVAPRAPPLPRLLRARRRVRRDQRPLGPARGGDRRPDRQAGAAHGPRAARRRGRRDLRADRAGRAARSASSRSR